MIRCWWNITIASGASPFTATAKHFEVLVLSGAQAGLNWSLVLKKREGYRRAFDNFDPEKVARYSEMTAVLWSFCTAI